MSVYSTYTWLRCDSDLRPNPRDKPLIRSVSCLIGAHFLGNNSVHHPGGCLIMIRFSPMQLLFPQVTPSVLCKVTVRRPVAQGRGDFAISVPAYICMCDCSYRSIFFPRLRQHNLERRTVQTVFCPSERSIVHV